MGVLGVGETQACGVRRLASDSFFSYSPLLLFMFLVCVCMYDVCACSCIRKHTTAHVWRAKDKLWFSILLVKGCLCCSLLRVHMRACMDVCMDVSMHDAHVLVFIHECVCACVVNNSYLPQFHSMLLIDAAFWLELEFTSVTCLANQLDPGTPWLCLPSTGVTGGP